MIHTEYFFDFSLIDLCTISKKHDIRPRDNDEGWGLHEIHNWLLGAGTGYVRHRITTLGWHHFFSR